MTANAVGFGVNIDEAGNVPNDVTAALKAAGIITDANIANGSFNGELTATNMAALLTQLNSTNPPSPLAKLIDVSSYGIGDGSVRSHLEVYLFKVVLLFHQTTVVWLCLRVE